MTRRILPHAPRSAFSGTVLSGGEIVADETNNQLWLGDGVTAGGLQIPAGAFKPTRPNFDTTQTMTVEQMLTYGLTPGHVFNWIPFAEWAAILDGTTTYNATAACQSAIDTWQADFRIGNGVLITDVLYLPNNDSAAGADALKQFSMIGHPGTIFQERTANTGIFKKVLTAGVLDNAVIGPFSVRPHASGSTASAIYTTGLRNPKFNMISGRSNGTKGFYAVMDAAAHPYLCYGVEINNPVLAGTDGYTKYLHCNNNGAGSANNPNVGRVTNPWIVDNTADLLIAFDCENSAAWTVEGGLIESNPGATAVKSGNATQIRGMFLELNAADIGYGAASNSGTVQGCYFSNAHNVDFQGTAWGNLWIGNTEPGTQTFINSPGVSNTKIKFTERYQPAAPTLVFLAGQAGTLTFVAAATTAARNQFTGNNTTFYLLYTWTPGAATSYSSFTITLPASTTIVSVSASKVRDASGVPAPIGFDPVAGVLFVGNDFADAQSIGVYVTLNSTN